MAAGLRFEALAPVDLRSLPPFESFPARDGTALPLHHFAADARCTLILLHGEPDPRPRASTSCTAFHISASWARPRSLRRCPSG